MQTLRVGISTCPNDTYAFHALIERKINVKDLKLEIVLGDVQTLNDELLAGELDVAKASFHAALLLSDRTVVLPVGAALGFGAGPLLLSAGGTAPALVRKECAAARETSRSVADSNSDRRPDRSPRVLCPGPTTTATLLFKMFFQLEREPEHVVFSSILPSLVRGEADYGVCIHEGRFTYADYGLKCVADLGLLWETDTRSPLPLGGIVAKCSLAPTILDSLTRVIRESLDYAAENRTETLRTMKCHARELDDSVIWAHVDLYVNAWTRELGERGRAAVALLSRRAREAGLVADALPALRVWNPHA